MAHPFFTSSPLYTALFWSVFCLRGLAEVVGSVRQGTTPRPSQQDRGSRTVLLGALFAGLALAFVFAWRWPHMAMSGGPLLVLLSGLALSVLGVGLRSYSMAVLGRFFTRDVTIQPGQHVVRVGPYRYVRHPCYTGSLLGLLGIALALTNWASLVVLMTCALAGYGYRIGIEEHALADGLGEPYVTYMRQTKRLVPFLV